MARKLYVGDGVYVEFLGGEGFVLTTENGVEVTNRIAMEWSTWVHLREIVQSRWDLRTVVTQLADGTEE